MPGAPTLLVPKFRGRMNRARTDRGRLAKSLVLGFVGLFFWGFVFAVIYRMLLYFRGTQGIGDVLAGKLLGMALVTFLMILLLSNVITALSSFFLSDDLELLMAAPIPSGSLYGARLFETIVHSSWMVALLAIPLLLAYGVAYGAGPLYYLLAAGTMAPFLVLPAVVGSALTLLLVNVFPARRTRDLLALVGIVTAGGVVAFFRFLRPERLMRPEEFRSLVDFVSVLRTPTSPWLPSEWASEALLSHLNGVFAPFPLVLLWTTAAAFVVIGTWLHGLAHRTGFTRAQEGAETRGEGRRGGVLDRLLSRTGPRTREIYAKEIRLFFRDSTQWSQLILLGVLVVVYVYNIRVLPLYSGEQLSFFLVNLVSFLNLGLAGFVVAAIAARFVFPAMSLEGRMMWLLRSSPLDVRTLFWSKYWVGTLPLLALALPLIVVTNLVLRSSPLIMALTTVTMAGATLALTAMALGFGALYPNYETENVAEIPTSYGGLLFMMAAVTYLGVVVVLEAWPMYLFLSARLPGPGGATVAGADAMAGPVGAAVGAGPLVGGLVGAAALTAVLIVLPLRAGIRRVRDGEP